MVLLFVLLMLYFSYGHLLLFTWMLCYRGLALGIALTVYGREEEADDWAKDQEGAVALLGWYQVVGRGSQNQFKAGFENGCWLRAHSTRATSGAHTASSCVDGC